CRVGFSDGLSKPPPLSRLEGNPCFDDFTKNPLWSSTGDTCQDKLSARRPLDCALILTDPDSPYFVRSKTRFIPPSTGKDSASIKLFDPWAIPPRHSIGP